jgi:protease-4
LWVDNKRMNDSYDDLKKLGWAQSLRKPISLKWKNFLVYFLLFLLVGAVAVYFLVLRDDRITYYNGGYDEGAFSDPSCNVAGINIHGDLVTYASEEDARYGVASSEDILFSLWEAEDNENIKAVILEVDSHGGLPVAGEEIYNTVKNLKKPVIGMIRQSGLSAGYWAVASADAIFASEASDVGSIGVTMSYIDSSKYNQKEGFTYNEISSGKFKNSGDSEKALTKEEREIFQRDVDIIYENFLKYVALGRNMDIEKVRSLADGSSMLGQMALENGLIDHIGSIKEVEDYIGEKYNIEPEVCW